MTMRLFLPAVLAALFFPGVASTQTLEIFGAAGIVQLWDDEGNLGAGAAVGGGVGFRSPHGWGIEGLAQRQKATRDFDSDVHFDSTVTAGQARIIKYFGAGRTQPYAGAGAGVMRVASRRDSPAGCALVNNVFTCTRREIFESASASAEFSGFAGVRVPVRSVMFVRPEFVISRAGEHMRIGGIVAVGGSW